MLTFADVANYNARLLCAHQPGGGGGGAAKKMHARLQQLSSYHYHITLCNVLAPDPPGNITVRVGMLEVNNFGWHSQCFQPENSWISQCKVGYLAFQHLQHQRADRQPQTCKGLANWAFAKRRYTTLQLQGQRVMEWESNDCRPL